MARLSLFKPEYVEEAKKLCELGATDREVADFFEVTETTLNNWKLKHPELIESLKEGKAAADERVIKSLYRRALGYSHDAVKIMSVLNEVVQIPYVEHYPPDTTAAIFWLKNRQPADWRDVKAVEHSGSVKHEHALELTDEQILERLERIGLIERTIEAPPSPDDPSSVH